MTWQRGKGASPGSVQRGGPAGPGRRRFDPLLGPAGTHRPAQRDMGTRKVPLVRLVRQHLEALHEATRGGMAIACGGLVVAHSGMILLGNHLTGL